MDSNEIRSLMQGQQDKLLEELNLAVEDIQRHTTDDLNVVTDSLNYVLEQSTNHKQETLQSLKKTQKETGALYAALQQFAENVMEAAATQKKSTNFLVNAVYGLAILNLITIIILIFGS